MARRRDLSDIERGVSKEYNLYRIGVTTSGWLS
jgi:hypothetical protein